MGVRCLVKRSSDGTAREGRTDLTNPATGLSKPTDREERREALRIVESLASNVYGRPQIEILSRSNNLVARISDGARDDLVLKAVIDDDVDLDVWNDIEACIRGDIRTVRVMDVHRIDTSFGKGGIDILVLPYLDRPNLVQWLQERTFKTIEDEFVSVCSRMVEAGLAARPPRPGFGPFKRNRELYATPHGYYDGQVRKFARRIATTGATGPVNWTRLESALSQSIREKLASDKRYGVMPVDINFKNFLVTEASRLVVLNVPIFIYGPLTHGLASISFQARGQGRHRAVSDLLLSQFPFTSEADLALFECYNALGVLAFYAHGGPEPIMTERMWGSTRTLAEVLVETAETAHVL